MDDEYIPKPMTSVDYRPVTLRDKLIDICRVWLRSYNDVYSASKEMTEEIIQAIEETIKK